jgi:uncharacterized membrane protein
LASGRAPVVVEALDPDREADWVAAGSPARAYVAWPNQLLQWGYTAHELRPRIDEVERIYRLASAEETCALMAAEGIDLVLTAAKERRRFGDGVADKFRRPPFREAFSSQGVALYGCGR